MIRSGLALATLLTLAATSASAQDVVMRAPAAGTIVGIDPISLGRAVSGAPYLAEAITEVTQVLADGNRIEQRTTTMVARDSDGRTRREQQAVALGGLLAANAAPIITITDPATGTHVTLNSDLKVAFSSRPRPMVFASEAPEAGVRVEYAPAFGMAARGAAIAATPMEGAADSEALPARTIEGLYAEGVRTTMTIPAGAIGNLQPIHIVSERWYSPELQVVLMTRRVDPRFGETVYRLTNIRREEPPADLFRVPPDYRLEQVGPGMRPVKPLLR